MPNEMPVPRYYENRSRRYVGMTAKSLDGSLIDYLWLENDNGDLKSDAGRSKIASLLARLKVDRGIECAIGPAVNLGASDDWKERIVLSTEPKLYGLYIQADKRFLYEDSLMRHGLREERDLRQEDPNKFEEIFSKIKERLPLPG